MKNFRMLIFCGLLVSGWAHATVLYDESISGDLATFDSVNLDLVAGVNSILGSSTYIGSTADFDGFIVTLGSGLKLTSIDYYISNVSVSNTYSLFTAYDLRNGDQYGSILDTSVIDILGGSPQSMFSQALPITGALSLSTRPEYLSRSGDGGTWDYEIRFTTTRVPEPASLLLMGLGLVMLGLGKRNRK